MHITAINPDPLRCPLCGQANHCLNLGAQDSAQRCWCNDPALRFPAALLARVPMAARGKACICQACVQAAAEASAAAPTR